MPETTPLFQTQTTYTFAEYRRYSRALQNKVMHRPLVIAVMMACLVLLALLSDDNSMRVAFLIVAVLTPLIFSLIGSRMEKKAYYANTAMQDVVLTCSLNGHRLKERAIFRVTASSADGDEMGTKRWGQGRMSPNRAD